jgi:hypothetical protein
LYGQLSERNAGIGCSQRGAAKNLIDLLLREAGEFLLSGFDTFNQSIQFFLVRDGMPVLLTCGKKCLEICHTLLLFLSCLLPETIEKQAAK